MSRRKLAIVTTHPVQYYAPVFRALAESAEIDPRVFYTWSQAEDPRMFDAGFGVTVAWDVPLRAGYAHQFVANRAKHPGPDRFSGIRNPTLIAEIEAWGAEAVLVYGWNKLAHLQALRHFKSRVPVFFRGDSTLLDPRSPWRSALRRVFLGWVYRHVDVAIAVGSHSRDYFAWCGLPAQRIAIAAHSVDSLRFARDLPEHAAAAARWREELAIPSEAIVVLFAGKLQAKKAPQLLLDAFCELQGSREPPARGHLVFVGHGELEQALRARASGRKDVHFLPFQNQSLMPAVYRLADLFVLPSQGPGETWGLALNEAIASGRAVVASSRVGGARDLISPGINGWIFAAGAGDELVSVLRTAFGMGQAGLRHMGAAARRQSVEWSSEACASRIAAIVSRYCSARRTRLDSPGWEF